MDERVATPLRDELSGLSDRIAAGLGDVVGAVVLFGSHARGDEPPAPTPPRVLIALTRAGDDALGALGELLHGARRQLRVEPFIVTGAEVPRLLDVFPVKALCLQRYGELLAGAANPFAGLTIEPEHLRLRAEQETRNLLARLRHSRVQLTHNPVALSAQLARATQQLVDDLEALLELQGVRPPDGRTQAVLGLAADHFDLDRATLLELGSFPAPGEERLRDLVRRLLPVVEAVVTLADRATVG